VRDPRSDLERRRSVLDRVLGGDLRELLEPISYKEFG